MHDCGCHGLLATAVSDLNRALNSLPENSLLLQPGETFASGLDRVAGHVQRGLHEASRVATAVDVEYDRLSQREQEAQSMAGKVQYGADHRNESLAGQEWNELNRQWLQDDPDNVLLDIGGKVCETTRTNLARFPDSFFAAMLHGHWLPSPDGTYFVDRTPTVYFEALWAFLTMPGWHRWQYPHLSIRRLRAEFDFFQVPFPEPFCFGVPIGAWDWTAFWSVPGSRPNHGLSISKDDEVFVASTTNVFVFNLAGMVIRSWPAHCCGLALYEDELYWSDNTPCQVMVTDPKNVFRGFADAPSHVMVTDLNGVFQRLFGETRLDNPGRIRVHKNEVYVLDDREGRIQVFSTAGAWVRSVELVLVAGLGPTELDDATSSGIRVNDFIVLPDGNLLLASRSGIATISSTGILRHDWNAQFRELHHPPTVIALAFSLAGEILAVRTEANNNVTCSFYTLNGEYQRGWGPIAADAHNVAFTDEGHLMALQQSASRMRVFA